MVPFLGEDVEEALQQAAEVVAREFDDDGFVVIVAVVLVGHSPVLLVPVFTWWAVRKAYPKGQPAARHPVAVHWTKVQRSGRSSRWCRSKSYLPLEKLEGADHWRMLATRTARRFINSPSLSSRIIQVGYAWCGCRPGGSFPGVFPDMEPIPDIELRAENHRVMGLFGADNPVGRLADLVADEKMFSPPLAWLVDEIAETLMPFLVVAGQPAEGPEG